MDVSTQFLLEQLAEMIYRKLVKHKNDEKNTSNKSKPISALEKKNKNVNHDTDNIMSKLQNQSWQKSSTKSILCYRLAISATWIVKLKTNSQTIRTLVSHGCRLSLKKIYTTY